MAESDFIPFIGGRLRRARFEQLVEAHLPVLFRIARGLVNQPADAEDLVHDACVKAIGSFSNADFSDPTRVHAWINQILVNTFRDRYRRAQRSPVQPFEYHATSDEFQNVVEMVHSTELSPLESIQNRHSSSAITHAFSSLPPEVRVVSVLFMISGLSYREIAEVTGCPIGTVMSRLSRGRQLLRKQLSDFDPRQSSGSGEVNRESL